MKTDKHALFHKRIARVDRINGGQDNNLEPRRKRRVLRILLKNHQFLWSRDPQMKHPGRDYRRAISRAA